MFVRSAALKELVTLRACLLALGVLSEATGVQVKVDVVEVMEVFDAYIIFCAHTQCSMKSIIQVHVLILDNKGQIYISNIEPLLIMIVAQRADPIHTSD